MEAGKQKREPRSLFCVGWQGWFEDVFSLQCIPLRHFLRIRMNFSAGNHPPQTFSANQDEFPRWKSSLSDIFCKSGCFSPLEINPLRHFYQIRMHFSAGNHPSKTFPANQDDFLRWKSSPTDISCKSGCISPLEIIPLRHFLQIRMHLIERNHLWTSISANQDEFSPLKKPPPKTSLKKPPHKAYKTGRVTLDKRYNSFREKFNEIRTPTKRLMIKKKR